MLRAEGCVTSKDMMRCKAFRISRRVCLLLVLITFFSCKKPDAPVCDGLMLAVPDNPAAAGPWDAGVRTVVLAGLTTEVWYPAAVGSAAGGEKQQYDIREHIPDAMQAQVTAPVLQDCDCYRDLPPDTAHGPYPVIIMVHGFGGFRTASAALCTHWAGRGFIVLNADNPWITLKDLLTNINTVFFADQAGDTRRLIAAVQRSDPALDFLAGLIDGDRIGAAGHSAGGRAIQNLGRVPGVRVLIPMASGGVADGSWLVSSLVMGAEDDGVWPYDSQLAAYTETFPEDNRYFVGIADAGHLAFTDVCAIERDKGGLLGIADTYGLDFDPNLVRLGSDGCGEDMLSPEAGWDIVRYATTAVFEAVLQCSENATARLLDIENVYPGKIVDVMAGD